MSSQEFREYTAAELRELWQVLERDLDPDYFRELARGVLKPQTESDRANVRLREELRRRGLFNHQLSGTS